MTKGMAGRVKLSDTIEKDMSTTVIRKVVGTIVGTMVGTVMITLLLVLDMVDMSMAREMVSTTWKREERICLVHTMKE